LFVGRRTGAAHTGKDEHHCPNPTLHNGLTSR
jgi:hypothetical protein